MQRKKKALFVTTVGNFLQLFEWSDVRILQRMNYEVHYAADFTQLDGETEQMYQNGNVILHPLSICRSPFKFKGNAAAFFRLRKLMREEKFELVHCHTPMGSVLARLAAIGQEERPFVLYTVHGFHFYRGAPLYYWMLYFPVEYLLARKTDCLITVNEEDYLRALHFPVRGGKVERIPGVGVNVEQFLACREVCGRLREAYRAELRKKHGISEGCFYVLTAGELNQNKNQEVLIRAVALLKKKQVHLGICGVGPLREELEQLARKLGVMERVSFLGYRKDLTEILAAADAFAFPSFREGFAIAPLEALAAGLPLITSERRDSREYIRDGENGLVCRKNVPREYADAILLLFEKPKLRERLSEAGRKTAEQYALPRTARIMERVYRECQRKKSRGRKKYDRRKRPYPKA